ncbi:MAG TPA: P-II family nitrogen regulator [Planctomycetota bacterium]|nr:P-II family nitrogen regulator [Planctomycetota bacterium]
MKKIEAIIKPFKLEEVKEALSRLGIRGLTVSEVQGHGRQKGHAVQYRGAEVRSTLVAKMKIEVVVSTNDADAVVQAILRAARTGEIGDGKVFVSNLESVVRIRTGEKGDSAV